MTDKERREMEQMRRDAEQRVREMNARARAAVSGGGSRNSPHFAEQPKPTKPPSPQPPAKIAPPPVPPKNKGLGLLKMLNFQSLKLDNDILVIAMMIMLLGNDDADELLLLALLYIMW